MLLVALGLLSAPTAAQTTKKKTPKKTSQVIKTSKTDTPEDGTVLLHDGKGHYFFVNEKVAVAQIKDGEVSSSKSGADSYYYGTKKRLEKVPVDERVNVLSRPTSHYSLRFWDPHNPYSSLVFDGHDWGLDCTPSAKQPLKLLRSTKKDRERVWRSAKKIEKRGFSKRPLIMLTDPLLNYYYVEYDIYKGNADGFPASFRLFIGAPGAMKAFKVMRSAFDRNGLTIVTADGVLRVEGDPRMRALGAKEGTWTPSKGAAISLRAVFESQLNDDDSKQDIIFQDLGVYLGTEFYSPCEPLVVPQ